MHVDSFTAKQSANIQFFTVVLKGKFMRTPNSVTKQTSAMLVINHSHHFFDQQTANLTLCLK